MVSMDSVHWLLCFTEERHVVDLVDLVDFVEVWICCGVV